MGKNAKLKAQRRANMARIQQIRNDMEEAKQASRFYDEVKANYNYVPAECVVMKIDNVNRHIVGKYDQMSPAFVRLLEDDPTTFWETFSMDEVNIYPPYPCVFFEWDLGVHGRQGVLLSMDTEYDDEGSTFWEIDWFAVADHGDGDKQYWDAHGIVVYDPLKNPKEPPFVIGGMEDDDESTYDEDMTTVFFAIGLMNCRNVETVEHTPSQKLSDIHQQFFGTPLNKYKTLRIKQTGKNSSSDTKDYQDLMPLHLRRGNFATYTDSAPLFGKYTGTFWRPATAVGSEKNGIVVKDYEVAVG